MNLESEFIFLIKNGVKKLLPKAKIFIFGSRAKETNRKFSDIDIAIKDPDLNFKSLAAVRFALEESGLPYKVDVVNYNDLDAQVLSHAIEI